MLHALSVSSLVPSSFNRGSFDRCTYLYTSTIKIEITVMIPNLFFVPWVVGGAVDDVDYIFEDLLVTVVQASLLSSCASPSLASLSSYNMDMASSEKLSLVTKLLVR